MPLHTLSRVLGHASIQTTMRYAHWCAEDRREAARLVGAALCSGESAELHNIPCAIRVKVQRGEGDMRDSNEMVRVFKLDGHVFPEVIPF